VIAATNAELLEAVEAGVFRRDLYYRLNVVTMFLPPLRERRDDIPLLAKHFLKEFSDLHRRKTANIDDSAVAALVAYEWPGNVRELRNVIEEAVILSRGSVLRAEDLKISRMRTERTNRTPVDNQFGSAGKATSSLKDLLTQPEKQFVEEILNKHNWNCSKAADELKVSRTTLYKKMNRYGIEPPRAGRGRKEKAGRHEQ
jgi:DNA-binding NtrC family response regulator